MNTIQKVLVLALVALALTYLYTVTLPPKPKAVVDTPEVTPEVVPEVPLNPSIKIDKIGVDEPTPPVQNAPAAPLAPPLDDTYPAGEFVVVSRVSVVTDSGVKAFSVGERVKKLDNGYSNGKIVLNVPMEKLTNLRSIGEPLAKEFQEKQALALALPTLETEPVAPPPISPAPPLALPSGPDPRIAAIDAQITKLNERINYLQNKATSQINANGPTITRLKIEVQKLEAQKAALTK